MNFSYAVAAALAAAVRSDNIRLAARHNYLRPGPKNRFRGCPSIGYDGLGLRLVRAHAGCGRPRAVNLARTRSSKAGPEHIKMLVREAPAVAVKHGMHSAALAEYGSQRKAAAALGLSLGTFQRRLAKERAAS